VSGVWDGGRAMDIDDPVFPIAVAGELAGMHPQTLRQYDRLGLVSPRRTAGRSRRYCLKDIQQLREVARLSAEGVSLEGIRRVLSLENEVDALRGRVRELEAALATELMNRPGRRIFASTSEGDVVSLRAGARVARRTELVVWRPWISDPDDIVDAEVEDEH
jgi:MerR family transcriptional regulator/heat shock protein HspR